MTGEHDFAISEDGRRLSDVVAVEHDDWLVIDETHIWLAPDASPTGGLDTWDF